MEKERVAFVDLVHSFIGIDKRSSIEHQLLNVISFFGGLIALMTVVVNIIIGANWDLLLMTFISVAVCWSAFYISRYRNMFESGRWILSVFMFGILEYIFFINNGSRGPLLHFYLVFFMLILFLWNGRTRLFIIVLLVLNITAYFLIELYYPNAIQPYENENIRIKDVYLSYYFCVFLAGGILMFAKNSYVKENVRAEQSDKLKSAFLANMSHEIRTPMNAILGFTQLLQKDLSDSRRESFLKVIEENSQSLLRLIEDIIDISKIEAGELKIKTDDCNLHSLMTELGETFRRSLSDYPEKNIQIVEQFKGEVEMVLVDTIRLRQILVNLLSNAFKYTERGTITFGYHRIDNSLKFFVRDTGVGIKDENINEIFDRFRKIETEESIKIQPGTGIGLSISKNLVRLMGGEIGVESVYNEGAEFYFTIPYEVSDTVVPKLSKKKTVLKRDAYNYSGKVILIVEDDKTNFELLKRVIERTEADIIHAKNGKEAIQLFSETSGIDLVLMDIMMPEMNGYEASEAIKKINSEVPIIAQTALAMEGDAKMVMDSGCDDYISKPIRISELLEMMDRYINR